MSEVPLSEQMLSDVRSLLDNYLLEMGLRSGTVRRLWVERVVEMLQSQSVEIAPDDVSEEAVERLGNLIEARLADAAPFDPASRTADIARTLVVLQQERHGDLLNALFSDPAGEIDEPLRERLRNSVAAAAPWPAPEEAPLEMPVQLIELRTLHGPWRTFRRSG